MIKAIGLDLGTTTLGIAVSDSLGFVHGVETFTFPAKAFGKARERVHQIVKEKDIKLIALGLPLHMSGEISEMAKSALRFKDDLLKEDPSLTIEMIDERLTTLSANRALMELGVKSNKRKQSIDRIAACEILDTFIRSINNASGI